MLGVIVDLSKAFLCDLSLMVENADVANYADDNTPYTTGAFLNGSLIT